MSTDLRTLSNEPFRLLTELAAQLRATAAEGGAVTDEDAWVGLGFRIADSRFLVPRADVREILRPMPYTRIPGARPWLFGIANVRGSLLPLIDLPLFLGLDAVVIGRTSRLLVFADDSIPAGFMVDEVIGFRRFSVADQRHELVGDAPEWASPYVLGTFVREGQEWPVFSLLKLVHSVEFQNAGR